MLLKSKRNKIEVVFIVTFLTAFFIDFFARANGWYYLEPWLDGIVHFMFGLAIFLLLRLYYPSISLLKGIIILLIIALAWEFLELYLNNTNLFSDNFITDTTSDILLAAAGAFVGERLHKILSK